MAVGNKLQCFDIINHGLIVETALLNIVGPIQNLESILVTGDLIVTPTQSGKHI